MANKRTVIIGGGPAGSTVGSLLKRHRPQMDVTIIEREKFPRDHVGESQLPTINDILMELGVWDKVEAANFPIKIGATYRWGNSDDLWDFEFIPGQDFTQTERPGKFEGQRMQTSFQVDRAVYDKILLDHSKELGCEVREETRVVKVHRDGDRVTGLELEGGEMVVGDYYIDATGHTGILRRAMEVKVEEPTNLKNVAFWDYWRDADWAVTIGKDGTRVQVLSLGYGWIWFIPIGPDRTSVGLIIPAAYLKESGKKPEEIYLEAIHTDDRVGPLLKNAKCEDAFSTTKDWSFMAERLHGENWFLAGESAGFADPILAAGLTLAHIGARHVAYTIIGIERGKLDADWLKTSYTNNQRDRMSQHIRFADFWYTGNGLFTDLKQVTAEIADDAGLNLTPDQAFQWLGTGGFLNDNYLAASVAEYSVSAIKVISERFRGGKTTWAIAKYNWIELDLDGAVEEKVPLMLDGRINEETVLVRNNRRLPKFGIMNELLQMLNTQGHTVKLAMGMERYANSMGAPPVQVVEHMIALLENLVQEGWAKGSVRDDLQFFEYETRAEGPNIHANRDDELFNGSS
jgi:flavin-dependent dehydrogenase